jgi:hypothetical protein
MRKASTRLPEQGTQIAVPCSGPHPRSNQKSIEDLHSDWYSKWGHFIITYTLMPLETTNLSELV